MAGGLTLLRVGSVRFSAFYFAVCTTAIAANGRRGAGWIALAAAFSVALCLVTELTNRLADRVEDEVNNPRRTAMCDAVGYARIRRVTWVLHAVILGGFAVWQALAWNPVLLGMQLLSWLVAWNYSFGLRFKARPLGVLVALTGTFVLPFAASWSAFAPLARLPAAILLPPLFVLSIAGIKDVTDVEGDRRRGYESAFVRLLRPGARARLIALLCAPHTVTLALVLGGVVPRPYLALLLAAPASLLLGWRVTSARTPLQKSAARELAYHVWFAYLLGVCALIQPTPALAGAVVFWVLATHRLHWSEGFRLLRAS